MEEKDEIEGVTTDSFKDIFTCSNQKVLHLVLDSIEPYITADMAIFLYEAFTTKEVVESPHQIHPTKAPSPNGMPAIFFHKFWYIVNNDVLHTILGILKQC